MSAPIPLRRDFDASQLRGFARKTKDGRQRRSAGSAFRSSGTGCYASTHEGLMVSWTASRRGSHPSPTRTPCFSKQLILRDFRRNSRKRGTTRWAAATLLGGGGRGVGRCGLPGSRRQRDMRVAKQRSDGRGSVRAHQPVASAMMDAHLLELVEFAQ